MKKIFTQTSLNVALRIKGLVFVLICLANSASAFVTTICDNNGTAQHPVWICMTLQNVPCSQVSYIAGMTCSEQYFAVPPKIIVLTNGSVLINNQGVLSPFASDKVNTFLMEKVAKLSEKERKIQFSELLKSDNKQVSKARIEALSKELNAEIIYSKETIVKDQPTAGMGKAMDGMVLSLGAGITNPTSSLKQNANVSNGYTFGANLYLPILKSSFGGATGGVISYGVNVGAEYFAGNKDYDINGFRPYNVSGQTGNPTISAKGAGSPKEAGFKTEAGIQTNFTFGKVTISPILNAAYFSLNQKAFAVTQNSSVNGQSKDYNLYNQAETKTSGLAFIPKVQFRYRFGRDSRFSIYTEANYTLGPDIKNETISFKPNGTADPKTGAYNIDQMLSGTNIALMKSNGFKALGVNAGISFSFLSKKGYNYYKARGDMASAGASTNPNFINPLPEADARAARKAARKAAKQAKKATRSAN